MRLRDLIDPSMRLSSPADDGAALDLRISGLSADSREIRPGAIFFAIEGTHQDGLRYLPAALENGAVALVVREGRNLPDGIDMPVLHVAEPRKVLALMAARLLPGMPETVAAVTGTNGKTSVATFLRQIWSALGIRGASMGTLGVMGPDGPMPLSHTTPDPVILHQVLKALHDTGTTHVALEASSHGLEQDRLAGLEADGAGFTNLTRDHLDYHGSLEAYREAKARLFREVLRPGGTAVINMAGAGADYFRDAARSAGRPVMTVGTAQSDLALRAVDPVARGLHIELAFGGNTYHGDLPLFGTFQAENVVVALALAVALGADFQAAAEATASLVGAPGRLEKVGATAGRAPVFVDYAHTPDALEHVLRALRPHTDGRLHVVFGCGGDRDTGKRPQMGAVAAALADRIIVTDDNPRSENPDKIRDEILAACPEAREIGDRARAIQAGLEALVPGDLLVIAGKGHETGQIVGDTVLPFNDGDVVRGFLEGRSMARG